MLHFHSKNGYVNETLYYIIRTLPFLCPTVLFYTHKCQTAKSNSATQTVRILVLKQLCYHAHLRRQNKVEKSGGAGWGCYRPSRVGVLGLIAARVTWPPRGVCQDPPPTTRKPKKRLAVGAVSHVRGRFFHLKQQTPFLGFSASQSSQTNVSSQ